MVNRLPDQRNAWSPAPNTGLHAAAARPSGLTWALLRAVKLPIAHVRPCLRLLFVVFGCLFAHLVEIGMYTAAVHALAHAGDYGRFVEDNAPSWWRVWYYSAETYTSLGYGDELLEGPMRLLSGIECLNGLVLIGWTVSYLHMAMLRAWPDQLRGVE